MHKLMYFAASFTNFLKNIGKSSGGRRRNAPLKAAGGLVSGTCIYLFSFGWEILGKKSSSASNYAPVCG